jgi:CarD family transcriptional regulator
MAGTATATRTSGEEAAFGVGDAVVHPHHGAGVVVSRSQRRPLGGGIPENYLEIELAEPSLRIIVPCDAAESVGLRAVIGERRLRRVVEVLEGEPGPVVENWSARQKGYRAKLKGGDVLDLAAVIRDLAVRDAQSPLSSVERQLYERSRQVLASELRYALGVDEDRAAAYIDEHVAARALPAG